MSNGFDGEEISGYIRKIDWSRAPDLERQGFSNLFIQLELLTLTSIQAETSSRSRLASLVATFLVVLVFSLFGAGAVTTMMAALGTQSLMFLLSQLFESKSRKLAKGCESATLECVKSLARRYPIPPEEV